MAKKWVAIAAALALSGSAAIAADWAEQFKVIDTDGSGTIAMTEWEANAGKLGIDPVPQFQAMDKNNNSSISKSEWTAAEKMVKAFPVSCKSATESWCPPGY